MFKTKPEPHTHMHAHTHASQTGTVVSTWITLWFQVCSSCLSYFNLTLLCVNSTVYFSVYNCKPFFIFINVYYNFLWRSRKRFYLDGLWVFHEYFSDVHHLFTSIAVVHFWEGSWWYRENKENKIIIISMCTNTSVLAVPSTASTRQCARLH